ncbi:MAG: penicillin-binding protein 2 [Patescibacteria group bacterium]
MGARITVLIGVFALAYGLLGFRFFDVQVSEGDLYGRQASAINIMGGRLIPRRGSIYFSDKDGAKVPAAINKEYPVAYVVPDEVKDIEATASFLSELIPDKSYQDWLAVVSKEGDPYEPLIEKPSEDEISTIEEKGMVGIYIGKGSDRFYPLGKDGAQVLGFASTDQPLWNGEYGIESYYNEILGGKLGEAKGDKIKDPVHGKDIQLTIDTNIQSHAEEIVESMVANHRGVAGMAVVAEVKTGKILAMVGSPGFDPNSRGEFGVETFLNPVVQSVYEPGSIFKVITISSALDAGKVTPETTYYDSGESTYNTHTIRNWDLKGNGTVTVTNILEKSINTGAAFVERQLGHDNFISYLEKFGFQEKTNINLPGEVVGSISPLKNEGRDINFATASFGQGISTTPIRLLTALSAVVNDGEMMRPYINADEKPQKMGKVVSKETSQKMIDMMVKTLERSPSAIISGYSMGGKTGTAQVPKLGGGGYTDEVIITFVGFGPATDPKFIILVRLDKPYGRTLSYMSVVPAYKELAQFMLNYYNVPPDNIAID